MTILFLLLSQSFSQTLSWKPPEGMGKEFEVTGYYVQYQIFPEDNCDVNAETPYFVDVKDKLEHALHKDPNFQPGTQYLIRVASYNTMAMSNPSQAQVCVRVRGGKPKMDNFEVDDNNYYDDQTNNNFYPRGEEHEEKVSFDFGTVGIPAAHAASSPSDTDVGPRRAAEHRRILSVLRHQRRANRPENRYRQASHEVADEPKLHLEPIKRSVAAGNDRVLRDDSRSIRRDSEPSDVRVSSLRTGVQDVQSSPPGSDKPDNRVIWFVVGGILLGVLILLLTKKSKATP